MNLKFASPLLQSAGELQIHHARLFAALGAARRFFNNAGVQQFPAALYAAALDIRAREFFEIGSDLRDAPPPKAAF